MTEHMKRPTKDRIEKCSPGGLLFVKLMPFPDSRFRAFGLLDVSILMLYSLYLHFFGAFAYRLVPGGADMAA